MSDKLKSATTRRNTLAAIVSTVATALLPTRTGAQAASDWRAEWAKLEAAAKKEGKLVLSGPVGVVWREPLMAFQTEYPDISIEYTPGNSRDFWPRVSQEHKVDQYLWDLRVGGIDPFAYRMRDAKSIDPVRPELILPEVINEANWYGGFEGLFADKEKKYLPGFLVYRFPPGWVNRDVIAADKLAKLSDLLKPDFAGKISLQDFRGGAAVSVLSVMIRDYGEEFVTKLIKDQKVVITRDNRQQAEWLIRGQYPIALAVSTDQLTLLKSRGVPMNIAPIEGLNVTVSGFGSVQLIKKRPHPNAARLYVNWLLTKRTQATITKAAGVNSRRVDVPIAQPLTAISPSDVAKFTDSQAEPMLRYQGAAVRLGRKLVQ
jgi:hypothetical protein